MYKAIIFDLDGTLLNTIDDLCDSMNVALTYFEKSITIDECKYFVGSGVDKLIERCLNHFGINTFENFNTLKRLYLNEYKSKQKNKTAPYPGIVDTLEKLKLNNIKLSVLSNKPDDDTKSVINYYFDSSLFNEVWGKKEGFNIKPNPDSVLEIIKSLGIEKCEIVYCGDSDVDVQTAKNAGVDCIAVTWGFRTEAELSANNPKYIVNNVKEIINIMLGE